MKRTSWRFLLMIVKEFKNKLSDECVLEPKFGTPWWLTDSDSIPSQCSFHIHLVLVIIATIIWIIINISLVSSSLTSWNWIRNVLRYWLVRIHWLTFRDFLRRTFGEEEEDVVQRVTKTFYAEAIFGLRFSFRPLSYTYIHFSSGRITDVTSKFKIILG